MDDIQKKGNKGKIQDFYLSFITDKKRAVETLDLTRSFGWGSSEGI